ncbi:MAG: hypothetical protein QM496_01275 [Verrucomicrobiota bacterium]
MAGRSEKNLAGKTVNSVMLKIEAGDLPYPRRSRLHIKLLDKKFPDLKVNFNATGNPLFDTANFGGRSIVIGTVKNSDGNGDLIKGSGAVWDNLEKN